MTHLDLSTGALYEGPDYLNWLVAKTRTPAPMQWSPWTERAGWYQAPSNTSCYEIGVALIHLDYSLSYMVIETPLSPSPLRSYVLLVGPKEMNR